MNNKIFFLHSLLDYLNVVILICLFVFITSCGMNRNLKKIPDFRVAETLFAKSIKNMGSQAIPIEIKSIFTTKDNDVVSFVKYENLYGNHQLKWEWYSPDGQLYDVSGAFPVKSSENKYIKEGSACHKISLTDGDAQSLIGKWKVKLYLDDAIVSVDQFYVEDIKNATKPELEFAKDIDFGNYYALIIGNNDYLFLPKLKTAIHDANTVGTILKDEYGYDVTILNNATRSDILLSLTSIRKQLTPKDNLLIYYAGHGWLDKEADEGYWFPVDAQKENTINWVSNANISSSIKAIPAKHVLIVADSCFSGKLTRGILKIDKMPQKDYKYLSKICKKRARSVISSGGLEPVADSGGKEGHSIFAAFFIEALKENKDILVCGEMFSKIQRPVLLNSDQSPEFADIRKAGHEGGDFIFIRKNHK